MQSRFLRGVLAPALVVASASSSSAAPHPVVDRVYHCTLIARDQDLAPLGVSGRASINAYGQVAFGAGQLEEPFESEIRIGYGDEVGGVPLTRLVARGSGAGGAAFLGVGAPSIDNSGRVAYLGNGFLPSGLGSGIFRERIYLGASLPTPLVETLQSDASSPIRGFQGEPLPDHAEVFFKASYTDGGPQRTGMFRNSTLDLDLSAIPDLQGAGEYAYDAGGSRAYAIQLDIGTFPNIESRLYLGTQMVDSVPSAISQISGLSVASNVGGMVSYGRFDGAGFEVRVWAGTPLVYVDSDDDALVASGPSGPGVPTSINDYGEVALVAGDGAEAPRRVFLADGDVIHRVVCENDGILPHLIGSRAINSAGQIAFVGEDGQGQAVVARADPLQGLPISCAGLDAGSACDDGDPETAATCIEGECRGNPIERPISCLVELDDTPCDDGDPATLAFCENTECVPVPLSVPEPDAPALPLAALAALVLLLRHR